MKHKLFKHATYAAGLAATTFCGASASAQSSVDALLDKLVDKGVLSTQEAKALKEETDKGFTKAYQSKSGMPDWVTAFKINGDFRGRAEGFNFDSDNFTDRMRYRYRLRLGAVAVMKDNFEVGMRLSSSDPSGGFASGDPISGNSTLQDNASRKFFFVDLAYAKFSPIKDKDMVDTIALGKIENPFVVSDGVFDPDYNPEGIANSFTYNLNPNQALKLNAGAFVLDEIAASSKDPWYYGVQARWDATWAKKLQSSVGVGFFSIQNKDNLGNAAVPNINAGNSRDGAGNLLYNYNPWVADGSVTYNMDTFPFYKGVCPFRVFGEFLNNPAAPSQNSSFMAGAGLGKSGKKGTWGLDYRYKYVEADSWYEEFTDSDFGGVYAAASIPAAKAAGYSAGTNTKGHVITASYSPFDSVTLQLKYFATDLIRNNGVDESRAGRFQVDALWKF